MFSPTTHIAKPQTLQAIVEGICKKQQWAQVALYDRFFEPAYHTAFRIVRNQMAAEDAVHEGFIKAFDKMARLNNPEVVEGWLKRIVLNEALMSIRANKHYNDKVIEETIEDKEEPDTPTVALDELLGCMNELPEGYRIICQLHLIEEMKHDQIAEALDISASTSRSQLTRAKAKLREIIAQKGLLK